MEKTIMENNIFEWMKACESHLCENKKFSLMDNTHGFNVAYICDCGEIFELELTNQIINDSTGFSSQEHFDMVKLALKSHQGQVALMVSCCPSDAYMS